MDRHLNLHRFYVSTPLRTGPTSYTLDPAETRHALSVLRLKDGDPVELCDGKGRRVTGLVERAGRRPKCVNVVTDLWKAVLVATLCRLFLREIRSSNRVLLLKSFSVLRVVT